ncbi:MAG TPA: hypothetical protein ENO09_02080 [bacterium]|nr:hypothetical protein [bacterium]
MHAQKLQQIKSRIDTVHHHRDGLEKALENGDLAPYPGLVQLSGIAVQLAWLNSLYKNVQHSARASSTPCPAEHPAEAWARDSVFEPSQMDCITTIMLKILDGKCKMDDADKIALSAVYSVIKTRPDQGMENLVHELIAAHGETPTQASSASIHAWRMQAEERIPKPVMKSFKLFLHTHMPR